MPLNTVVPIDWRPAAPAPCANISGTTPRMKAKAVIRIGRSRRRAASIAASTMLSPSSRRRLANSTIRIAFLAERPMSITKPICEYTSIWIWRSQSPESAPNKASGTVSRTMKGMVQLSY
jgi:hypothetical protein